MASEKKEKEKVYATYAVDTDAIILRTIAEKGDIYVCVFSRYTSSNLSMINAKILLDIINQNI